MAVQTFRILRDCPGGVVSKAGIQQNIQRDTQAQQQEDFPKPPAPRHLGFGVNHNDTRLDGQVKTEPGEMVRNFFKMPKSAVVQITAYAPQKCLLSSQNGSHRAQRGSSFPVASKASGGSRMRATEDHCGHRNMSFVVFDRTPDAAFEYGPNAHQCACSRPRAVLFCTMRGSITA